MAVAALTGRRLLIEDCSLIMQPGCGRHRRGQEERSRAADEARLERAGGARRGGGGDGAGACSCGGGWGGSAARAAGGGGRSCSTTDPPAPPPPPARAPLTPLVTRAAPGQWEPALERRRAGPERRHEAEAAGENRFMNERANFRARLGRPQPAPTGYRRGK